jgi:hypothetical protein
VCPAVVGVGWELTWSPIGRGGGAIGRGVGSFEPGELTSERCKFHECCGELGGLLLFDLGVLRVLLYWSNPVSQVLRAMAFKRTTRGRSNFGELMTAKIS